MSADTITTYEVWFRDNQHFLVRQECEWDSWGNSYVIVKNERVRAGDCDELSSEAERLNGQLPGEVRVKLGY